jgi:hypothetical protein
VPGRVEPGVERLQLAAQLHHPPEQRPEQAELAVGVVEGEVLRLVGLHRAQPRSAARDARVASPASIRWR